MADCPTGRDSTVGVELRIGCRCRHVRFLLLNTRQTIDTVFWLPEQPFRSLTSRPDGAAHRCGTGTGRGSATEALRAAVCTTRLRIAPFRFRLRVPSSSPRTQEEHGGGQLRHYVIAAVERNNSRPVLTDRRCLSTATQLSSTRSQMQVWPRPRNGRHSGTLIVVRENRCGFIAEE